MSLEMNFFMISSIYLHIGIRNTFLELERKLNGERSVSPLLISVIGKTLENGLTLRVGL